MQTPLPIVTNCIHSVMIPQSQLPPRANCLQEERSCLLSKTIFLSSPTAVIIRRSWIPFKCRSRFIVHDSPSPLSCAYDFHTDHMVTWIEKYRNLLSKNTLKRSFPRSDAATSVFGQHTACNGRIQSACFSRVPLVWFCLLFLGTGFSESNDQRDEFGDIIRLCSCSESPMESSKHC